MSLDGIDRLLLDALRRDGRASFEELGRSAGVSRTAARARVQRMVEAEVVRIETVLHPAVHGISTVAHVSVVVVDGAAREVANHLAGQDECPLVSLVAGQFMVIAELRTSSVSRLEEQLRRVRALGGVTALDTLLYTDIVKDPYLPLGRPDEFPVFALDDVDLRLLELLQERPRMAYNDLSAAAQLSRGTARARVGRLLDRGVVAVTGLATSAAADAHAMCGFELHLGGGPDPITALTELPQVDFLARTLGRCDAVGTIVATDSARVGQVLTEMSGVPGVQAVEAWWHLELVKERYGPPRSEHATKGRYGPPLG